MALTGAGVTTGAAGTTINAGTLQVVGTTARLDSGNIIVNSGGTLLVTGSGTDAIGNTRTITVASGGVLDMQQTGAETVAGISIAGTGTGNGAWVNSGNSTLGALTVTNRLRSLGPPLLTVEPRPGLISSRPLPARFL